MATPWIPRSRPPMNLRSPRFRARRIALAALVGFAAAAFAQTPAGPASPHREIYMYQGADRDKRLVEGAKKERLLEDFHTPALRDIVPEAFPRGHRQYVADRFAFFVMGYNTSLVKREELPATYGDLLQPRWAGRITIEGTDVLWFAAVAKAMGEDKGVAYFRKLAAMRPEIRHGHIHTAQLVASGEVPFFLTAYNNNIETLKLKGAPVEWKPLQPAFGQAAAIGVSRYAPHPHAALLFTEFVLSKEGQEILKSGNRVPTSRLVDSPLNKFKYEIIDPMLALDEGDKWDKLFSDFFLGGKAVQESE